MSTSLAVADEAMERQPLLAHAEERPRQSYTVEPDGNRDTSIRFTGKVFAVMVNFWVTGLVSSAIGVCRPPELAAGAAHRTNPLTIEYLLQAMITDVSRHTVTRHTLLRVVHSFWGRAPE
jgi:hypothetical protein